jgi:tetratricopeptide (TPR) repeat protein
MTPSPFVDRIRRAVAAHPGLVLEGEERTLFLQESAGLELAVKTVGLDQESLVWCAWALRKLGRFPEAHDVADRALAQGRTWKVLTAKASVYRAQGRVEDAVALYEEAAALDPSDTSAMTEAAQTLGEAGRTADAAAWFGRAADRDPRRTDARAWQEYALFQADRDPARVERVRAIAEREPDNAAAKYLLAWME